MTWVLDVVAVVLTTFFRALRPGGIKALVAENLALPQQLIVLKRSRTRAPNLRTVNRLILAMSAMFILVQRVSKIAVAVAVAVSPATILRFHRDLVRRKYRNLFTEKSKAKPGPKGPAPALRAAIVAIKQRNPRFGCQRIAMIVSRTFDVEIGKDVVRRVLAACYRPDPQRRGPGPSLAHIPWSCKDSLWSVDLFRCESITLQSHWVIIALDQYTRRIVGFGVHRRHVDGRTLCRMFNSATAGHPTPLTVSTDHDPLFRAHRWQANLRILEIEEIKTVPYVPLSHPFVERTIGTVRREFLDQTLFWNATDLSRRLESFRNYYNEHRVHRGLAGKNAVDLVELSTHRTAELTSFRWQSCCRGLVHLPVAA